MIGLLQLHGNVDNSMLTDSSLTPARTTFEPTQSVNRVFALTLT
jgi:hypothetical protein